MKRTLKKAISLFTCTMIISILIMPTLADDTDKTFKDVRPESWYYTYVTFLSEIGAIEGYSDNNFYPEKFITNAEYLTCLYKVMEIDLNKNVETFEHWGLAVAEKAKELLNYDEIKTDKEFLDSPIKKEVAVKISLKLAGMSFPTVGYLFENPFVDLDSTTFTYQNWLISGYEIGLISGNENNEICPKGNLTRAEACKILTKLKEVYTENISKGNNGIDTPVPDFMKCIKIKFIGENSKAYIDDVSFALNSFPIEYLKNYSEDGGEIILTNESPLEYTSIGGDVAGLYSLSSNNIIIFIKSDFKLILLVSSTNVKRTLEHEFSHYLWFKIMDDEDKRAISNLYNSDKLENVSSIIGSDYCKTNESEFWSELMVTYISSNFNKEALIRVCPENVIEIINKYLKNGQVKN